MTIRTALADLFADLFSDSLDAMLFASDEEEIAGNPLWFDGCCVVR